MSTRLEVLNKKLPRTAISLIARFDRHVTADMIDSIKFHDKRGGLILSVQDPVYFVPKMLEATQNTDKLLAACSRQRYGELWLVMKAVVCKHKYHWSLVSDETCRHKDSILDYCQLYRPARYAMG